MRIGDTIYHLDGQPFRTLEWAERMRTLLSRETGFPYHLESHPGGGYVLRRADTPIETPGDRSSTAVGREPDPANGSLPTPAPNLVELKTAVHRPAVVRANVLRLPLLLGGMALVMLPEPLALAVLKGMHMAPGTLWTPRIVTGLMLAGGCLTGGIVLTFWTEWASAAYTVSANGVEARIGLFARDIVGLRYQDIRSVTLKQSLFERLVGIGTIEFASAGTQDRPVRFLDIARPVTVKAKVEACMRRASED
jgi:hypothetical protein